MPKKIYGFIDLFAEVNNPLHKARIFYELNPKDPGSMRLYVKPKHVLEDFCATNTSLGEEEGKIIKNFLDTQEEFYAHLEKDKEIKQKYQSLKENKLFSLN